MAMKAEKPSQGGGVSKPQLEPCGLAAQGIFFFKFVCSVLLLRLDVSQIENFKFSQIVHVLFLAVGLFLLTNT